MPDLLAHTNMDAESISRLREELSKMTQWLARRVGVYFSAAYEPTDRVYRDKAAKDAM